MTMLLAELLNTSQLWLQAAFVIFLRVGSALALVPAFGEQMVPARVRLVLGLSFTAIVAPGTIAALPDLPLGFWLLGEVVIGLVLGMMLRLFVICLQIAGTMAAQATSLSQLFGGTSGEPQPAVGELLTFAGLALAVHFGLHVKIAEIFMGSYRVFPPGEVPDFDSLRHWGLAGVSRAFSLAFSIAAPFVIAGLIYNIALGAINRAMPQLMVAFVGAPALTLGGLVLLSVALPSGLMVWQSAFDTFLANPFRVTP